MKVNVIGIQYVLLMLYIICTSNLKGYRLELMKF